MKIDASSAKFTVIFRQVSSDSLLSVSVGNCQRTLVYESGMIITQMETQDRSDMVAEQGASCAIPPSNSNSNSETQS
jgi:hypothetical protein